MRPGEQTRLLREVPATAIPAGSPLILPKDTEVTLTQSLGGSHTVAGSFGLARIEEKDQDALGLAPVQVADVAKDSNEPADEKKVWDKLKEVFDPEIPVNVVDLGLIYSLELKPLPAGGSRAEVKMTLTAPGCGMGPTIQADARSKILSVAGVKEAEVELVWEPAWTQSMISEEGKMKLGWV
ncbi:MAG: putative Fe-S cluster assembly protein SufT [Proteobacteria bacterium]|nr:putative Fe-S cluster assembly protein SufT [Pseudomonadota bacterium]NBS06701.1 putative Fe-S cluster assembly protein SufT [Verrucomicrobiota bacterium]NBS79095.1 putative Fe-S cluster assembly protein SufT [bacterium]NBS49802.1 putative Fe-S cluster assembly protein SufT [Verrucomicrobiota bacterium]NBT23982.1 putative Fe-S cluster assembly protein SufT [bacterium]